MRNAVASRACDYRYHVALRNLASRQARRALTWKHSCTIADIDGRLAATAGHGVI